MKKWWRFLVSVIVFLMFLVNLVNATDIYDCNQLQSMSLGDAHRLMNDINCNEINFVSIGDNINKFTGSLNGRGYKIYGLHRNNKILNCNNEFSIIVSDVDAIINDFYVYSFDTSNNIINICIAGRFTNVFISSTETNYDSKNIFIMQYNHINGRVYIVK